ncbi:hypothetical protein ColLi_09796 [Colletotrichum liriopes]|uniref:Uncharacterized protein n=1 Tax=Colletotrichum liriopes TaxID=708192 RepID=A0AA37GTF4_9PEZI|nr:hypothetical protein ColLi_09796 [Colletotrichum liriopes]
MTEGDDEGEGKALADADRPRVASGRQVARGKARSKKMVTAAGFCCDMVGLRKLLREQTLGAGDVMALLIVAHTRSAWELQCGTAQRPLAAPGSLRPTEEPSLESLGSTLVGIPASAPT